MKQEIRDASIQELEEAIKQKKEWINVSKIDSMISEISEINNNFKCGFITTKECFDQTYELVEQTRRSLIIIK